MAEQHSGFGSEAQRLFDLQRLRASHRQYRLFAASLARTLWDRADHDAREWVETAELYADGAVPYDVLMSYCAAYYEAISQHRTTNSAPPPAVGFTENEYVRMVCHLATVRDDGLRHLPRRTGWSGVRRLGCERVAVELLGDIFGNELPLRVFDPHWRSSKVTALAAGIYAERTFDRLPVLADALADAGCDAADLLAHLRGDGPHVRGCWALDLVLGKS